MKRIAFVRATRTVYFTGALRVIAAAALLVAADVRAACAAQPRGGTVAEAAPRLPARPPLNALPAAARVDLSRATPRAERGPRDATAAGEVAMLLHAHDQLEPARHWYEHARRLNPASFDWAYGAGLTGVLAGRHLEAVAALRDAVRLDSRAVPARLRLAEALLALGDAAEASTVAQGLAADFPRLPQAHYVLGRAAAALGDYDERQGITG